MDRYKEGYNDCNREWKKKIKEEINWLIEEGYWHFYDSADTEITQNILQDLLKKG